MKRIILFTFILFFAFSCTKVSTETGKEKLEDATQSIITEINLAQSSNIRYALSGLFDLSVGPFDKSMFMENSQKLVNIGIETSSTIKKEFAKITNEKIGTEAFDFASHCGTYTWQDTSWSYSSSPSDQIIIIFPSENSTTNDCKLVWSKYEEVKTNKGTYLPTIIYAELYYNDEKVAYLDFDVTYDLATEEPIKADVELFTDPFLFKVSFTFENNILDLQAKIKAKGYLKESLETKLTFTGTDEKELVAGSGVAKVYEYDNNLLNNVVLKIVFDFDYTSLDMDNATCAQINDNTNIELYTSSGRQIGYVECVEDDDCGAQVVFNDGTTQSVCYYTDRISQAIGNAFDE